MNLHEAFKLCSTAEDGKELIDYMRHQWANCHSVSGELRMDCDPRLPSGAIAYLLMHSDSVRSEFLTSAERSQLVTLVGNAKLKIIARLRADPVVKRMLEGCEQVTREQGPF